MADRPWVGDLAPEWMVARCSYAEDERSVACLADATWHGIVGPPDWEGLGACDNHKAIMSSLTRWVHPFESACELPDAKFHADVNRCIVPWDDSAVAVAAEAERDHV